ncbi:MAG: hypothetical protein CFE21_21945 [Bacteroidetes bacterium B1(2017)]|nr:MAG: hypothetical protein CFE21_21945 [Bacteroidetes bacterium B1(2017)]
MKDITRICYVCGFYFDSEQENQKEDWPFIMCKCCDFEYGIIDLEWNCLNNWRDEWINTGLKFDNNLMPSKRIWTLKEVLLQLSNLKLVDINNYPRGKKLNPNYSTEVNVELVYKKWIEFRNSDG